MATFHTGADWSNTIWFLVLFFIVCVLLKVITNIRRQIKKAGATPGYWQVLNDGLLSVPILTPHLAHGGSDNRIMALIEKEIKRSNESGKERPIVRVSTFSRNNYVVFDNESLKEMLITKASSFLKVREFFEPFNIIDGCNGIVSAIDGPEWKRHHTVCSSAFGTSNLKYMSKVSHETTQSLMKEWDTKPAEGFQLDLADFNRLTLDVLGKAGFGINFGLFNEASAGNVEFRKALESVVYRDYLIRFFFGFGWMRKLVSTCIGNEKQLHTVISKLDEFIEQRRSEFKKNLEATEMEDVLSLMVKANMLDNQLSDDELKNNAYVFCVAGYETTSTTMKWMFYELSKNPEIQERARQEAKQFPHPTYDDYPNMDYLQAVMMETLRLHSPALSSLKECVKTTTIGPHTIPKGSRMYAYINGVHRFSPEYNNETYRGDQFAPERFLDKEFKKRVVNNVSWMPFSLGPRKCLGYMFAQIETCMIVPVLLQQYEFILLNDESNPADKVIPVESLTNYPSNLRVKARKISDRETPRVSQ